MIWSTVTQAMTRMRVCVAVHLHFSVCFFVLFVCLFVLGDDLVPRPPVSRSVNGMGWLKIGRRAEGQGDMKETIYFKVGSNIASN